MKTVVTFVNTRTGSRADVRVGPDPLMLLAQVEQHTIGARREDVNDRV